MSIDLNSSSKSLETSSVKSISAKALCRTSSTELESKIGKISSQKIGPLTRLGARALSKLGLRYIKIKTESNKTLYVRIDHIKDKLKWSKQEVKEAFTGENGLAKLQEAFALEEMANVKDSKDAHTSIGSESDTEDGVSITDSDSDVKEEMETKKAIVESRGKSMAETISSYKDKIPNIQVVAQKALEALKNKTTSVAVAYSMGCLGKDAHIFIIDPQKLTIKVGHTLGMGSAGHVFDVENTAIKINSVENLMAIAGPEDLASEVYFLKELGLHEGIAKVGEVEEVHDVCYLNLAYEPLDKRSKLHMIRSYQYDGNAKGFIKKYGKDPDYSSKVISMQEQVLKGYDYMHSKGCYHLDGKPDNFYYKALEDKTELVVGDFGSAIQVKVDGVTKVPLFFEGTKGYTTFKQQGDYGKVAKEINRLVDSGAPPLEIKTVQEECKACLKKADDFQKAVTLYQMCVKDAEAFPYTRTSFGLPNVLELDKATSELNAFYGENHPIAKQILDILKENLLIDHS